MKKGLTRANTIVHVHVYVAKAQKHRKILLPIGYDVS